MPVYEYRCSECYLEFDKVVKAGEQNIKCPECSSPNVSKLISNIAKNSNNTCNHSCHDCSCN